MVHPIDNVYRNDRINALDKSSIAADHVVNA
jgi:hypothetical protein